MVFQCREKPGQDERTEVFAIRLLPAVVDQRQEPVTGGHGYVKELLRSNDGLNRIYRSGVHHSDEIPQDVIPIVHVGRERFRFRERFAFIVGQYINASSSNQRERP